jgi:hypothetical protein
MQWFWHFFIFLAISTYPWHPKGQGFGNWQKKCSTSSLACKIF